MIHRAVPGSIERFLGILIEHGAGAFPFWLAPGMPACCPSPTATPPTPSGYAVRLREEGLRAEVDARGESVGRRIRDGELAKVPYLLVVGDREAEAGTASARAAGRATWARCRSRSWPSAWPTRRGAHEGAPHQLGGVRNFLIIAAIAGIVLVWQEGFGALAVSAERIILVLFVAALAVFGYNYFRQNQLAWLVLKPWQRAVIIIAGLGIAFLLIAGFPLLEDRLTPLGVLALIAALAP